MNHRLLAAALLAPAFVCAAPVARDGLPLDDAEGPAWAFTIAVDAHLPAGLTVAGRVAQTLTVRRDGLLIINNSGFDAARPRPLGGLAAGSVIAPFWAPLQLGACPDGAAPGEVRRSDTPTGLRFAWIDVPLRGCPASDEAATFSVELSLDEGGQLYALEFVYEGLPSTTVAVAEPRAGFRLRRAGGGGAAFELFPDGEGGPTRGRAKSLVEGSSDGVRGIWTIEVGPEGEIVGEQEVAPEAPDGWRSSDNCPADFNPGQEDLDGNGVGDACDNNIDGDSHRNNVDNCPRVANPNQSDVDRDGLGDACDPDDDGDGWPDGLDRCPWIADAGNLDRDHDGLGDACDPDPDGDDWLANRWLGWRPDRCPLVFDPFRGDLDGDGIGDWCDLRPEHACRGPDDCLWQSDLDGDGVSDAVDLCPSAPDPHQRDLDGDGLGDACDADGDGDGVMDIYQLCPAGVCGGRPAGGSFGRWPMEIL